MEKWSFDNILRRVLIEIPFLGEPIVDYYNKHKKFRRLVQFAVSTTIVFWLIKSPLILVFNGIIPNINLILFIIPNYIVSTFIVGVIITLIGFLINEEWIWKHDD